MSEVKEDLAVRAMGLWAEEGSCRWKASMIRPADLPVSFGLLGLLTRRALDRSIHPASGGTAPPPTTCARAASRPYFVVIGKPGIGVRDGRRSLS